MNWINLCQDSNKLTNQLRIKSVKNQRYRQKYREKAKSSTLIITVITSKRRRCVVVITTAQLHLIIPEFTFWAGSNLAGRVSKICYYEDLWKWFRQEIRLTAFRRSTIPPKNFIIASSKIIAITMSNYKKRDIKVTTFIYLKMPKISI